MAILTVIARENCVFSLQYSQRELDILTLHFIVLPSMLTYPVLSGYTVERKYTILSRYNDQNSYSGIYCFSLAIAAREQGVFSLQYTISLADCIRKRPQLSPIYFQSEFRLEIYPPTPPSLSVYLIDNLVIAFSLNPIHLKSDACSSILVYKCLDLLTIHRPTNAQNKHTNLYILEQSTYKN